MPEEPASPSSSRKENAAPLSAAAVPQKRSIPVRPIVLIIAVILILIFGVPWIIRSFRTVSTDDAYVNSYVTFVAPRVTGQVAQVLVDDNNRVKKGDVLVQLDPEPYQVKLAIAQAALEKAQADYVVAEATARSQLAQARSQRFKLENAVEDVDNRMALIRQRAAAWDQANANLVLAKADFDRVQRHSRILSKNFTPPGRSGSWFPRVLRPRKRCSSSASSYRPAARSSTGATRFLKTMFGEARCWPRSKSVTSTLERAVAFGAWTGATA
jgi:multidrug efflux pump subunit AcrA (membrane-fusion protein)